MRSQKDYANSKPATLDLPYGGFKNESQPGAKDGTDIVAEHMQDIQYPLYQVLQLAGIVPNGELEDGKDKRQFLQSLVNVGLMKYAQGISYASSILVWDIVGGILTVYKSAKNNNTDDISNSDSWIKILSIEKNNKINFYVNTNISSGGNNLPVFCFNAGLVDAAGKAACVTLNGNTLTLLEGSVGTSAEGTTYTVAADVSIDISGLAEGTYNLFYDAEEGVLETYANTIFVSEVEPEMVVNDVWVDTSILPYSSKMKNSSGELESREIIPLPAKLDITSVSVGGGGATLMPENYNNNGLKKENFVHLDGNEEIDGIKTFLHSSTKAATTAFVKTLLASYAKLASPAFSGTPTAPTPASSDNSTKLATTAFVNTLINSKVASGLYHTVWISGTQGYLALFNSPAKTTRVALIQWGYLTGNNSNSGADLKVTFPIAFANSNYSLVMTGRNNQHNNDTIRQAALVTYSGTATSFTTGCYSELYTKNWIAIGK